MSRTADPTLAPEEAALRATEAQISATRERLAASVGALKEDLSTLSDWREWVKRRPLSFLFGALAVGFLIGQRRR